MNKPDNDFPDSLTTVQDPFGAASEAYRALRANLLYTQADTHPKVIVITSPDRRDGKSTTCANLGVVLSQADKSTLLLDCDFRKPSLHKIFALRNQVGITDVLADMYSLQDVLQEALPGVKVATAGLTPLNPAELVSGERFSLFLKQVRQEFDYVLVDSPPVGLVSDPLVLAAQADGVVLVFNARSTRKRAVGLSVRSLKGVGAHVLGTVMNDVNISQDGTAYGYSYAE
jgi:capsular exopolysaccharide synthesis family protein